MEIERGEDGNAHDDSMHKATLTHSEKCMHVDNSEKTATVRPNRKQKLCNKERRLIHASECTRERRKREKTQRRKICDCEHAKKQRRLQQKGMKRKESRLGKNCARTRRSATGSNTSYIYTQSCIKDIITNSVCTESMIYGGTHCTSEF